MMTGLDRLSYQSRWFHLPPERKFLFWLLLMILAFSLPPLGQAALMCFTAALTCWLLRISLWRWCRWMALPLGFLLVGVVTIVFSVSRDPHALLVSVPIGSFDSASPPLAWLPLMTRSGAAWRRCRPPSGWC